MSTETTSVGSHRPGDAITREAHWIVAIEGNDQRRALRTCAHRAANAVDPNLAAFWRAVGDHIAARNLGWSLS